MAPATTPGPPTSPLPTLMIKLPYKLGVTYECHVRFFTHVVGGVKKEVPGRRIASGSEPAVVEKKLSVRREIATGRSLANLHASVIDDHFLVFDVGVLLGDLPHALEEKTIRHFPKQAKPV